MKTAFRHVAWGIAFAGAGPLQTLAQGQGNEATEIVSVKQVVTEIVTIDGPPPQSSIVELVPMSSSAAVFVPPESAVTTPEATDTNVAVTADPSSAGSGARGSGCAMEVTFTVNGITNPVPWTVGTNSKSSPSGGQDIHGTCVCFESGSVRLNIGTTNKADHSTLFEGNAQGLQSGSWFDVSFVEGYSYPMVCKAGSSMSGCSTDLYTGGACPSDSSKTKMGDCCTNPSYDQLTSGGPTCLNCSPPHPFFGVCAGAAYTYPHDDDCMQSPGPNAMGGVIECCIGPNCEQYRAANPGATKGGNCNAVVPHQCTPCADSGFTCKVSETNCGPGSARSDLEKVFAHASPQHGRNHKRHHHHGNAALQKAHI